LIIIKVKKRLHGAEGDFWLDVDIELRNGEFLVLWGRVVITSIIRARGLLE